jgi:hypothetical protein
LRAASGRPDEPALKRIGGWRGRTGKQAGNRDGKNTDEFAGDASCHDIIYRFLLNRR